MKLFSFLQTLFTEGSVAVEGKLFSFNEEDEADSVRLLQQWYEDDKLELPHSAPSFWADAALWAARHVYLSLQLIVIRDAEEEEVHKTLQPYRGLMSPDAICSADITLRYLPDVLSLAKGLAPADIMVAKLKETASQWPFSSVGIDADIELMNEDIILNHPSLRIAYIDRIIEKKDSKRTDNINIKEGVREALGSYSFLLWPRFSEIERTTDL
jgi:hypothetical protein